MISVWQRVQRVWQANAHANVDRLERPEAMLNQLQRELVAGLATAKTAMAQSRAWQTRLSAQCDELSRRQQAASEAARRALGKENEELARSAIARRQRCGAERGVLERQLEQAGRLIERQQIQVKKLQQELLALRDKRASLLQRERFAQAMQTVTDIQAEMAEPIGSVLERMEEKVALHEASSEFALTDTDADEERLDDFISEQDVEAELSALKKDLEANTNEGEAA